MRIINAATYRFTLPLARPLNLKGEQIAERSGILVRLTDDHENSAWGEVSPLPGFSSENLERAQQELGLISTRLLSTDRIPEGIECIKGGHESWTGNGGISPSVRFGIETALLQLVSQRQRITLRHLLNLNARDAVPVNGLLMGEEAELVEQVRRLLDCGYSTFKLKVGRRLIGDDVTIVHWLRETVGNGARIRLDANRAWSLEEAYSFAEAVKTAGIDYIEEPVRDYLAVLQLINKGNFPLPISIDESLAALNPEGLDTVSGIKGIIVKPTLLGLETALCFARAANRKGMVAIISSSFETSIGLGYLAEIAASLNIGLGGAKTAVGLDTLGWLAEDLVTDPLQLDGGAIKLQDRPKTETRIRYDVLTEIQYDRHPQSSP